MARSPEAPDTWRSWSSSISRLRRATSRPLRVEAEGRASALYGTGLVETASWACHLVRLVHARSGFLSWCFAAAVSSRDLQKSGHRLMVNYVNPLLRGPKMRFRTIWCDESISMVLRFRMSRVLAAGLVQRRKDTPSSFRNPS